MNHPVILFLAFWNLAWWLTNNLINCLKSADTQPGRMFLGEKDDMALVDSSPFAHSLDGNTFSWLVFYIKYFTEPSTCKIYLNKVCVLKKSTCVLLSRALRIKPIVLHCTMTERRSEDHSPPNKMAMLGPGRYPDFHSQFSLETYRPCCWPTVFLFPSPRWQ